LINFFTYFFNKKYHMIHNCEISDSFVHPNLKLSGGKGGNGESRLFISNNSDFANRLTGKPWKITFDNSYKQDILSDLSNTEQFKKQISNRVEATFSHISELDNTVINTQLQQGNKDVNRNYIGQSPHRKKESKTDSEITNIKNWDKLRKSLMPTKTTLQFFDTEEFILVNVIHNNNVHKYNKIHGASFVQLEFLKIFGNTNNIEIQHTNNKGEFKLRNPENGYMWPVDGYHNCAIHRCTGDRHNPCIWNNTVFEFQGTYWHRDKKEKDLKKQKFYTSEGYKWFEITEKEWTSRKKLMKAIKKC